VEFTCKIACRSGGVYGCQVILGNDTEYSYAGFDTLEDIPLRSVTVVFNDVNPMMPHIYYASGYISHYYRYYSYFNFNEELEGTIPPCKTVYDILHFHYCLAELP